MKDRIMKRMVNQEDSGLDGLLSGEGGEERETPKEIPSPKPPISTGIEGGFTSPSLKGKSIAEVEELLKIQDDTIKDQGRRINQLSRQPAPVATAAVVVEKEEKVDAADFWKNPGEHLKKQEKRTLEAVRSTMEEIIAPFRQNLARSEAEGIWGQLSSKYPDSVHLRGIIEESLTKAGIEDPEFGTLETLYFAIKGRLHHAGKSVEDLTGGKPAKRIIHDDNSQPINPQHRPSSHPIPQTKKDENMRELTENERVMARKKWPNMTAKDAFKRYLDWLEEDEDGIVDSQIGKEAKK